jgi:hypothetical protein
MQYGSIFFITTIVCLAGAFLALFIARRDQHADGEGAAANVGDLAPDRLPDR